MKLSCYCYNYYVHAGLAGCIISKILEANFCISAVEMFHMEHANASEFYEVYRGVVHEYKAMVDELTLGSCLVLEVRAENAPIAFRELAGPPDPVGCLAHWSSRPGRLLGPTDPVGCLTHWPSRPGRLLGPTDLVGCLAHWPSRRGRLLGPPDPVGCLALQTR